MSLIEGKGTRFSSNAKAGPIANNTNFQAREHSRVIGSVPPPAAYQGLRSGPEISFEFNSPQAITIDGSNALLRNLSPFIIQVEMPLAFANEPTIKNGNTKVVGIYEAANRGRSAVYGKGALVNADYLGSLYQGGNASTQEVITKNAPDPQVNQSGDGLKLTAKDGTTPVGKLGNPAIADLNVAMDIALQLSVIENTPPLILLINPSLLTINRAKIQQLTDRTRHGYVFQAWGEEQPKLDITAKCGAFISGGRGVQFASKQDSASWQNLMSLFAFYKNNGYIHDTVGKSNAHHFVGGLSIHYDGWIYYGNMESLSYTLDESANQNGGVDFNISFVVTTMVDSSQSSSVVNPMRSAAPSPTDPRYFDSRAKSDNRSVDPTQTNVEITNQFFSTKEEALINHGDPDFKPKKPRKTNGNIFLAPSSSGFIQASSEEEVTLNLTARPEPFGI